MSRFYDRRSWRRLRLTHLAVEPLCRRHAARGMIVPGRQVDHVIPIDEGGDPYDDANLQTLCDECHGEKTRAEHGARGRIAFDAQGNPIDAHHHWNRGLHTC